MKFTTPKRKKDSHKGQNGKVLVVGGSEDYTGAVALAGLAALRSGCDIVTIVAPERVAWAINAQSPDLITKKMKGKILTEKHYKEILTLSERFDVLLFGNGMGLAPGTKRLYKRLAALEIPKVIDADPLKVLSAKEVRNAILTPNRRELEIFLKNSKMKAAKDISNNNILLCKGPTDTIIGTKVDKVRGGNPGLTKAGTGDVLAGLCAGYLAQLKDPRKAALNAARVEKRIGDLLLKRHKGYTYLASDMVDDIRKL